jgi:hypothetical protein
MSDLVRSVELKLNRAADLLQVLSRSVSKWVAGNPITAECKLRDGRLGFRLIQKEFATPAPLDEWGLLFGESVHNLRSALDNLSFALARLRRDPPERPNRISFPIYQDKLQFEKTGRNNIDQLPDAAADLIERLQPFQRDGSPALGTPDRDALVLLQAFSNADKHRVPSVVLIAPTNIAHSVSAVFHSNEEAAENVPPDTTVWAGPLQPGAVLLEWRTNKPIASVSGGFEGQAIVAIQQVPEPLAITPTLQALHQYTALVASQFSQFFK